jgi:hypothetical protein
MRGLFVGRESRRALRDSNCGVKVWSAAILTRDRNETTFKQQVRRRNQTASAALPRTCALGHDSGHN